MTPIFLTDFNAPLPDRTPNTIRCVILSDTHGHHNNKRLLANLPPGDVLIHLGDITDRGNQSHLRDFAENFLPAQSSKYRDKVVISGNHDRDLVNPQALNLTKLFEGKATLLQDEPISVAGGRLRLFGASWEACEMNDFSSLEKYCTNSDNVPIDILLTHLPPRVGDWTGSAKLARLVRHLRIPVHLSGHKHRARGIREYDDYSIRHTFVNCCTRRSRPVVLDWDYRQKFIAMLHCPTEVSPHPGSHSLVYTMPSPQPKNCRSKDHFCTSHHEDDDVKRE